MGMRGFMAFWTLIVSAVSYLSKERQGKRRAEVVSSRGVA